VIVLLYQKLLIGSKPYFISIGPGGPFEVHRHPELELSYCVTGSCDILCENKLYTLSAGDFALIPSMAAHEMPDGQDPACQKITLEFGYALLGEHFSLLSDRYEKCRCFRKQELGHTESFSKLAALTEETLDAYRSASDYRDLTIKANLFKISELLLQLQEGSEASQQKNRKLHDIKKIDKALETIYNSYFMPLNIESVSASCGYSKSNFCKIFKNITGNTFHDTLNRHRIEIACTLLGETNDSIEKIAQETGFADAKSFCRVFRKIMGKSAGEYRKSVGAEKKKR
jgi:AraC-like DNA-binding protein